MDQAPKGDAPTTPAAPGTADHELTVPVYARLGKTECQIGWVIIPASEVDLEPEQLRLACMVLAAAARGGA